MSRTITQISPNTPISNTHTMVPCVMAGLPSSILEPPLASQDYACLSATLSDPFTRLGFPRSAFSMDGSVSQRPGGLSWRGASRNTIGSVEQAQCLSLPPETAGRTERFHLRNRLIIQPIPCLNLGSPCQAILPRTTGWICPEQFFVNFRLIWVRS